MEGPCAWSEAVEGETMGPKFWVPYFRTPPLPHNFFRGSEVWREEFTRALGPDTLDLSPGSVCVAVCR